ncbi:hypothetical protein D3C75_749930 [compost metagenome]
MSVIHASSSELSAIFFRFGQISFSCPTVKLGLVWTLSPPPRCLRLSKNFIRRALTACSLPVAGNSRNSIRSLRNSVYIVCSMYRSIAASNFSGESLIFLESTVRSFSLYSNGDHPRLTSHSLIWVVSLIVAVIVVLSGTPSGSGSG